MSQILILRPEPGAGASAARARALGLEPMVAPLFTIRPLEWQSPEGPFGALLLTSANAPRHAGAGLAQFLHLPCFAVGEATAAAAREAGFASIETGPADGAAALALAAEKGFRQILHLCGRDHVELSHPNATVVSRAVYAADAAHALSTEAVAALDADALVLLHSPRAAAAFAALAGDRARIRIAAISRAAADAAGPGWAEVHVAQAPRDQALLELAAKLCKTMSPKGSA